MWPFGLFFQIEEFKKIEDLFGGASNIGREKIRAALGLLHLGKSTWNPNMEAWKISFSFKWVMFRLLVNFPWCIPFLFPAIYHQSASMWPFRRFFQIEEFEDFSNRRCFLVGVPTYKERRFLSALAEKLTWNPNMEV